MLYILLFIPTILNNKLKPNKNQMKILRFIVSIGQGGGGRDS